MFAGQCRGSATVLEASVRSRILQTDACPERAIAKPGCIYFFHDRISGSISACPSQRSCTYLQNKKILHCFLVLTWAQHQRAGRPSGFFEVSCLSTLEALPRIERKHPKEWKMKHRTESQRLSRRRRRRSILLASLQGVDQKSLPLDVLL